LALYVQERFAEAEREFETAIRLDPNLFEGWYFYARSKFVTGHMEEAARLCERAAEARPDDFQSQVVLQCAYRSLGRPADSRTAAKEALARAQRELARHPENTRAAYVSGLTLAVLGQSERAREWLSRALAIEPDDPLTMYNAACGYAQLGDLERAVELLERTVPGSPDEIRGWLVNDSDLDPLRAHPRFVAIIRQLGLEA
jgi:adenylate cyclase